LGVRIGLVKKWNGSKCKIKTGTRTG
jgi:hypothetical protein